jgi:ubiquinone/menaquinone biosynthesis C-methylase UbiE
MEHYLDEIQRVLKKGGRCLITFFLLNSESLDLIKEGKSTITFKYTDAIYAMVAKNMPEAAVAYDEAYIRTMYQNRRLAIREPILYGFWCGRQVISGLQDTVVADKV